jgi:hypothetical protein
VKADSFSAASVAGCPWCSQMACNRFRSCGRSMIAACDCCLIGSLPGAPRGVGGVLKPSKISDLGLWRAVRGRRLVPEVGVEPTRF